MKNLFQRRNGVRAVLVLVILLSWGPVTQTALFHQELQDIDENTESRTLSKAPASDLIAVTGQHSPNTSGTLAVFTRSKELVYFEQKFDIYFDVDPVPGEPWNVTLVTAKLLNRSECGARDGCVRNYLVKTNLVTGKTRILYERDYKGQKWNGWHDAKYIGDDQYVVGDIFLDRVFIVNTSTKLIEWEWDAQTYYDHTGGGKYLSDWTHLNDVEYHNGTVIISIRNFDQVIFVDRETGVVKNRTLGHDDDYSALYEQHNPDYIPATNGGPALLVGDSENDRVVEYQHTGEQWERTWIWTDEQMNWPRDADRLPNGMTLITDSHGNRVLLVDKQGEIIWKLDYALPYEAEYLGTPSESGGGRSAALLDLPNKHVQSVETEARNGPDVVTRIANYFVYLIPAPLRHGIDFVLPIWMDGKEAMLILVGLLVLLLWGLIEFRWSPYEVKLKTE